MMTETITPIIATSLLWLSTLTFIILYYRRLRLVNIEYSEARNVVEGIVITFKSRYDALSSELHQLKTQISVVQSDTQEMVEKTSQFNKLMENGLEEYENLKKPTSDISKSLTALQEDIKKLKDTQESLEYKISSSVSRLPPTTRQQPSIARDNTNSEVDSGLTETENIVLEFLLSEGPKTAKEVEVKIGKTREHTARLMKKLWQEGYVERETHKIPFTYSASAALRNLEKTST
jgi:chromosome segregation ATPase